MSYLFGNVLTANTDVKIALPFGSWKLYWGATNGATTTALTTLTPTNNKVAGEVSGTTVTLDPRAP